MTNPTDLTDETRAVIEKHADEMATYVDPYTGEKFVNTLYRMRYILTFEKGIAYRDKQLAETAGQSFDRQEFMWELVGLQNSGQLIAGDVTDLVQKKIERTAAAFIARIEELEAELAKRK